MMEVHNGSKPLKIHLYRRRSTMKFKQKDRTNQRIERITTKHAVVGIDIAKERHVAQITNYRGMALQFKYLSFTNTQDGFENLWRWVRDLMAKKKLKSVIVGMEPTGHYWFNLANWLLEKGISVVLVNPVITHRNKENRDNSPSKNDPKDALIIADSVCRGYYTEYHPQAETFERLKTAVHNREYWVDQSVSLQNRIVRWIDLYFPEYSSVFKDWTGVRSLATLRSIPLPSDVSGLQVDDVIEKWREQGMKRAGGLSGRRKAAELLAAAKRSVGHTAAQEEARKELQRLLDVYESTNRMLEEDEEQIKELLDLIPIAKQLESIKGLGPITIAVILGCSGDLRHYAHGQQLLRKAGLNLAECRSGKYTGQIKLSKRGDSMLRKYMYWATVTLISQNPEFKKWHDRNVNQKGLKKFESVFKLIGKLARTLIGMVQRGEVYRPEIAMAA